MNLHLGGIHMTVKLVFMNQADFADFKEHSLMSFANEQVKSGAYEKKMLSLEQGSILTNCCLMI